jgi:phosphatidate phosphatase APP1
MKELVHPSAKRVESSIGIMRVNGQHILSLFLGVFLPCAAHATESPAKSLASDERLLWFPALATPAKAGWEVTLHGLVFEPEKRGAVSWFARRLLGFSHEEMQAAERAQFEQRTRWFLADDEGGKKIRVEIAGQNADLGRTAANGHFGGTLFLKSLQLTGTFASLPCRVLVNERSVTNSIPVCVVGREGISVVTDIDDTIKVTNVRSRDDLLRNTFIRPFRAAEGMAGVYQRWAGQSNVQFHYVSGSPWQLFPSLEEFVVTNRFPAGSWHLRTVRLTDRSAMQLLKTPDAHKRTVIEGLFSRMEERQFVLVGDSGERDPEVYGDLARRHPKRVRRIFIRDVTEEPGSSKRYREAFRDLPDGLCVVFKTTAELPPLIP